MDIAKIIEAMIFVADSPVRPIHIEEVFSNEEFFGMGFDREKIENALAELMEKFKDESYPFELKQIDGGYQFFTKQEYYPFVRHAVLLRNQKKLSRAALETLAIIAYRQPITRPEMEFIRGVNCDYALQKLLDRKLIDIAGRSDAPGRPLLYQTSDFFMEYFGLNDIADLPKLQEFEINEGQFKEQFKVYLDEKDELEGMVKEPTAEYSTETENTAQPEVEGETQDNTEIQGEEE